MLSIITITRNDFQGLVRTIDSTRFLRTGLNNIEQIIIDGSNDDLTPANADVCKGEINLKYFRKEARGISDAFNLGITNATYEWLWFLNGGDQVNKDLDIAFFGSLLRNVTADILIFQIRLMNKGTVVRFPPLHKSFPPVMPWIPHPAALIQKEIFSKHGPFDEKYKIAMDYEFWLRVFGRNVVVNMISIPIVFYDENGISSTQIGAVKAEGKAVLMKYRMKLFKLWLSIGRNMFKQYKNFKKSDYEK